MTATLPQQPRCRYGYVTTDGPTQDNQRRHPNRTTPSVLITSRERVQNRRLQSLFPLDNPVNPHMEDPRTRLRTFRFPHGDRWQSGRVQASDQQIAAAGFFYLGERDRVKCWYCNGGLENWERDDDPWTEHAKWFPNCSLLLREMGPDFVHAVSSQFPNIHRPSLRPVDISPSSSHGPSPQPAHRQIIDPREEAEKRERLVQSSMTNSTLVQHARDMGFGHDELQRAHRRQYQEKDRSFDSLEELVDVLTSLQLANCPPQDIESNGARACHQHDRNGGCTNNNSTEGQIKRIEDERKCKICRDEKSCVVFVPCGHLAACSSCSRRAQNCPTCGSYVREKIKAFLA